MGHGIGLVGAVGGQQGADPLGGDQCKAQNGGGPAVSHGCAAPTTRSRDPCFPPRAGFGTDGYTLEAGIKPSFLRIASGTPDWRCSVEHPREHQTLWR